VFVDNKHGGTVTAFGAADGKLVGTIEVDGDPESIASDGKGSVWFNIEHKNFLVRIDTQKLTVTGHWPTAPCKGPGPIAIDREHRRLFIGCSSEVMVVANPDTGEIITTLPIGIDVDGTAFDPSTGLIFSANADSVTVIHEDSPDKYSVVENVKTQPEANTVALDPKTHRVYLSTGNYDPVPKPGQRPTPSMLPGTFKVLVLDR